MALRNECVTPQRSDQGDDDPEEPQLPEDVVTGNPILAQATDAGGGVPGDGVEMVNMQHNAAHPDTTLGAIVVDEWDDGGGDESDEDETRRRGFSATKPVRRSTLNVFSAAASEQAGVDVAMQTPKKRSSMTMIERSGEREHRGVVL
mmetsp:Transcript_35159/g.81478  ORF Transcript_35159/g.81478 Transcript_35159/m.81478 type:complete len:147 (-) Transcript_35159:104-544(-)